MQYVLSHQQQNYSLPHTLYMAHSRLVRWLMPDRHTMQCSQAVQIAGRPYITKTMLSRYCKSNPLKYQIVHKTVEKVILSCQAIYVDTMQCKQLKIYSTYLSSDISSKYMFPVVSQLQTSLNQISWLARATTSHRNGIL